MTHNNFNLNEDMVDLHIISFILESLHIISIIITICINKFHFIHYEFLKYVFWKNEYFLKIKIKFF